MSYDIYLKDRVTGETINLPIKHMMTGGIYKADYDPETNTFSPSLTNEAWLNITYNYCNYYYEATDGDERFANDDYQGGIRYGIRGIYGKSGAESIPMLNDMIARIEDRYKKDGEWITTVRTKHRIVDPDGHEYKDPIGAILHDLPRREEVYDVQINEGPNEDYWEATAANAIRPLYKLIAIAELRPDGVWDGD